ncbi:hypothetical protein SpCBS45565_g06262 [Spizellomyces sp. 'palustris']|nr:hypothetical protein SpCBS45565_g06262 [Spizellomyces sp. 'palustris']
MQPDHLEKKHVHEVYNLIADHFSATRYKPWPVVDSFLRELEKGSLGADVGCGNGKYLGVNKEVFTVGSDRSDKLIEIVQKRGFEAMVCDNMTLPYREACFDFVISIAVIHHMSSPERRLEALKELLRITRTGGRILVFVWAFEQEGKRKYQEQDVFVPWKMPKKIYCPEGPPAKGSTPTEESNQDVVYQRYYHLFVKGELDELITRTGMATIETSGYDRDNWYCVARKT